MKNTALKNYEEAHNEYISVCMSIAHLSIAGVEIPEILAKQYNEFKKKDNDTWQEFRKEFRKSLDDMNAS